MKFNITGHKHKVLSKEELRAILHACATVCSYHGLHPYNDVVKVRLRNVIKHKNKITGDDTCGGQAQYLTSTMWIVNKYNFQGTVSVVLHEYLHLVKKIWPEKVVSTLEIKLKRDVIAIANSLVKNTYQRAAFIAHAKIGYKLKAGEKDHYNPKSSYHKTNQKSQGRKYRNKRSK